MDGEARIAQAVARAARYLPGHHKCLAQAMAGQILLSLRGTPGTVIVGLKHSPQTTSWDAHAWLIGSRGIILGGDASENFVPVTAYSKKPTT
jgi:hypothetical protein